VAVFMLLGFNAFIALGSGISLLRLVRPLRTSTHDSYDAAATGRALTPYVDVFTISAVLAAITGMLYVAWLWRAYHQVPAPRRYGQAWVVLGWLLPPVNLWLPARLVHDAWAGSGRYRMAQRHAIGAMVTAWWVSVLASLLLAVFFAGAGTDSLGQARFAVHLGVAAYAAQALAAALCMMTVFGITRVQIEHPAT
jgi:hypothetical protein